MAISSHRIGLFIANPADRHLASEFLKEMGYCVCNPRPSKTGLKELQESSLIIVDEHLAGKYADELLSLKDRTEWLFLPILILLLPKGVHKPWLKLGFDDVLHTPLKKQELITRLQTFLRIREHAEGRYQELAENAIIGLYRISIDGNFLWANQRLVKMLACSSPEQMLSKNIKDFYEKDSPHPFAHKNMLNELGGIERETRLLRCDSTVMVAIENMWPIIGRDGNILGYEGSVEDITSRKQAEEAVLANEHFLSSIFESIQEGISVLDSELTILRVNPVMNLWYAKNIPLEGKKCYQAYHNRTRPCDPCPTIRCLRSGHTETDIVPGLAGSPIKWVELFSYPMKNTGNSQIDGVVEFVRDITHRKDMENKLMLSVKQWEETFNAVIDPVSIQDRNFKVIRANKSFYKTFGLTPEDLNGKACYEIVHSTKEPPPQCPFREMLTLQRTAVEEFFEPHLGMHLEVSASPITNASKELTGCVHIIKDITGRKMAEEKIRMQRDFLDSIIETVDVIIIGISLDGIVTSFNKKAEQIIGYKKDEIIGKPLFSLNELKNSALPEMAEEIKATGTCNPRDTSITTKNKTNHIIYARGTALRDCEGNISGVLGIGIDVTEERQMEEKLKQAEKLRSLGELAGGVAHDFNNVLAAILGRAQLLKMNIEAPPPEGERRKAVQTLHKGLDIIEKAARDGAETVRRIQEFARKRDDDSYFTPVQINEIIEHAIEFTHVRWKNEAEAKGLAITIHKDFSSLPPILGSASELREVFTNLMNNALDAMPHGGTITISTSTDDSNVIITFHDTGIGIPESIKNRIFDPFFTTKGVKSTGLGMSVSYGIINRHRGTITVDSLEGKGTTFTITLPFSKHTAQTAEETAIAKEHRVASILIIEDEHEVRELLSAILKKDGHSVESAENGLLGVELFEQKTFDLVFSDLGMPEMNGWEVAEKVKSINGRVPVVLITGWNIRIGEAEMKEKYVDLIIHKPFEVEKVLRVVQEGIALRERFKAV